MDAKRIDYLNIGLLFLSLFLAIQLPFKLFLFSYAVLGPLHYLTEINWLNANNFFTKSSKTWVWVFVFLAVIISLYPIAKLLGIMDTETVLSSTLIETASYSPALILSAFLFAVGLIFIRETKQILILLPISCFIAIMAHSFIPKGMYVIGLFLPTLIHVFLFTGLFMLYGAKRSKSKPGFLAAIILFLMPIIIIKFPLNPQDYRVEQSTIDAFVTSNMVGVSQMVAQFFGLKEGESFKVFSEMGFRIQIFIAFAYTYHYLNWFSKTSVIGWKNALSIKKTWWIGLIWLAAILIYAFDYETGFIALFMLSFLHVFLEFPLNAISIKGLVQKN